MEVRSKLNQCEIEVRPKWIRSESEVKSMWNRSEIDVRSKWHRSETEVESKWNRSEIEEKSKWTRTRIEVTSKWNRSEMKMTSETRMKLKRNRNDIGATLNRSETENPPPPQASLSAFRLVLRYPNFWRFYWVNLHKFLVRVFDLSPVQNFRVSKYADFRISRKVCLVWMNEISIRLHVRNGLH